MLTTHARRLVVLLAALTTLVALAGASVSAGVALASAPHASGAQNRVRGFTPAVELPAGLVASQFSCSRPGSTVSGVQVAAGFCVATKAAPDLTQVERVGAALKDDPLHRAASFVVGDPAAQRFTITGGDGVQRELYQLPGEVNGKSGIFEYIVDNSGENPVITHQRFINGGGITGSPNQRP